MTAKRRRKKMQRKQRRAARQAEQDVPALDVLDEDMFDEDRDGLCPECRAIEDREEAIFWLSDLMSGVEITLHETGLSATIPRSLKDNLLVRDVLDECNRNRILELPMWDEWVSKYGLQRAEEMLHEVEVEIEIQRD